MEIVTPVYILLHGKKHLFLWKGYRLGEIDDLTRFSFVVFNDTVDGSEIPNNHLGCIYKPC